MAETKYDPLAATAIRQGLEFDQAPVRALPKHYFVFDPHHNDPDKVGVIFPILDRHQNVLVPGSCIHPEHPLVERVCTAGEILECDESKPHLLRFLESNPMFRRARHSELRAED